MACDNEEASCDMEGPSCSRCVEKNIPCVYVARTLVPGQQQGAVLSGVQQQGPLTSYPQPQQGIDRGHTGFRESEVQQAVTKNFDPRFALFGFGSTVMAVNARQPSGGTTRSEAVGSQPNVNSAHSDKARAFSRGGGGSN